MRVGAWLGLFACALAAAPPARAGESDDPCSDGQRNGTETDVDCGGQCSPCWHRRLCRAPADCASGSCADGRCRERVLRPGEHAPAGYDVRMSRRDAPGTARLAGASFLVASYTPAYVAAISYPGRLGTLYLPLIGPWLTLDETDLGALKFALVADGSLQIAGAVMLIGGWALAGRQVLRSPPAYDEGEDTAQLAMPRTRHAGIRVSLCPGPGALSLRGEF